MEKREPVPTAPRQDSSPCGPASCMASIATFLAEFREETIHDLGLGPETRLLDAGCGFGELAIEVAPRVRPGGLVAGVDISADAIAAAQAAAGRAGIEVDFRVGDVCDLPYDDGAFDVVRCERVFQHLDPALWMPAARQLLRVVRPGGTLQLIDPNHLQTAIAATDAALARMLCGDTRVLPKSPESGLQLGGLLRDVGAVDVHVDVRPLPMTSLASYRETRGLDAMLRYLVASRQVTDERAAAFLADLEDRDLKGGFLATMVMYVASGRRTSSRVPTKE